MSLISPSLYSHTRSKLKKASRFPRKRLGQNFLIDSEVLDSIIEYAELSSEDLVLEIGPGTGIITKLLAQIAGRIIAVELDDGLFQILKETFTDNPNVALIHGDILDIDLQNIFKTGQKVKVIGNIPYYITTPILMRILESYPVIPIQMILIMVQEEVGERIVASPGTKDYGALSVAIAYRSDAEILKRVPAESFYPRPKVDSVLIKLTMRSNPRITLKNEDLFFHIVRSAFQYRRKTLRNALLMANTSSRIQISPDSIDKSFQALDFDSRRRGETLSIEEFGLLANIMSVNK